MNDNRKSGPLPERWLHCPRKAVSLLDDKFFAFKTPLDDKFSDQIPIEYRFNPAMVFQSAKNSISSSSKNNERRRLALWIDLTRTRRFYDAQEVESNECKYVKIECHGHEGAPNEEQTAKFIHVCKTYISKDPINVIGVHCTHGFNRTGFMLISLLVEAHDWNLDAAIREFARVRPPGIYKEDYLKELYRRFDDVNDVPAAPPLPVWCTQPDENTKEIDGRFNKNYNRRTVRFRDNPTFMDGVSGANPITDRNEITKIREKVRVLTEQNHDSFVGSQPVSMDRDNIKKLAERPYQVSWKADGTRYVMFIDRANEIYFLDRDNSVFKIRDLKFFLRKCNTQHLTNTLLDGEMVIDKHGNDLYPRFLVYDIVYFEGHFVGKERFTIRMQIIKKDIIEPRVEAMKEGRINREREPFSVRIKDFFDIRCAANLLGEKFARQLGHSPDGLIFQPVDEPYVYGTAKNVLKWKPLSMNSIDFKLSVKRVENVGCLPEYIGDLLTNNGVRFGTIKCNKTLRELNNKIIECKLDNNRWIFMRERTDKSLPNSRKTAEAVLESIRNPVTERMLLDFIRNHAWKDPMPPPVSFQPIKKPRTK